MADRIWKHPVFGSIPPYLRRLKSAQEEYEKFLKDKTYLSPTGTFAHYFFLRCLQDGIECTLQSVNLENGWYFRVTIND